MPTESHYDSTKIELNAKLEIIDNEFDGEEAIIKADKDNLKRLNIMKHFIMPIINLN